MLGKKCKILLCLALLMALLLSFNSCVNYTADIKFRSWGGGSIEIAASMTEEVYEAAQRKGLKQLEDISKTTYTEDGVHYVKLSKRISALSMQELREELKGLTLVASCGEEERVFGNLYYGLRQTNLDTTNEFQFSANLDSCFVENGFQMVMTVHMPAKIIETNGTLIDERTVRFEFKEGKQCSFFVGTESVVGAVFVDIATPVFILYFLTLGGVALCRALRK